MSARLLAALAVLGCWQNSTVTPHRLWIATEGGPEPFIVALGERGETLIPGASVDWPYDWMLSDYLAGSSSTRRSAVTHSGSTSA